MGKHVGIKVGDCSVTRDGVPIVVARYGGWNDIDVCDYDGYCRNIGAREYHYKIKWLNKDGSKRKSCVPVSDEGRQAARTILEQYKRIVEVVVGSVWQSEKDGEYVVTDVESDTIVTIEWASTQLRQTTTVYDIVREVVIDETAKNGSGMPEGHYVYSVMARNEIIYIGRGKGWRFRHPYSGISSCKELNRLYFYRIPMITEVVKQGMTYADSVALEIELIKKYQPKFNKKHK